MINSMIDGLKWLSTNIQIKTVLDVGASNGCWSQECLKFYPESNYVLFEPQPVHSKSLDLFSKNKNISVIKKAVGLLEGHTFFNASDPFGGSLSQKNSENTIKVEVTTIDNSMEILKLESPYLIKLDTHGYEKSILDGAVNTLEKTYALIIECYNYKISDESLLFFELCEYLYHKKFRPIYIVDVLNREYDNSLWQMDMFFIKSDWKGFEYNSYK